MKEKTGQSGQQKNGANGTHGTGRGTRAQKFKRDGTGRGTLSPCPVADPSNTVLVIIFSSYPDKQQKRKSENSKNKRASS